MRAFPLGRVKQRRAALATAVCTAWSFAAGCSRGADAPDVVAARAGVAAQISVDAVLDDFHAAAAAADEQRYFAHLAPDAVFLGTDAGERWSVDAFRAYAHPYFERGQGWTYAMRARHVRLAPGEDPGVAWFDELLANAKYGDCRGSGVLVRSGATWKIAQYNLSLPIPNAVAPQVVELIRGSAAGAQAK
jgi:hypothetical protein